MCINIKSFFLQYCALLGYKFLCLGWIWGRIYDFTKEVFESSKLEVDGYMLMSKSILGNDDFFILTASGELIIDADINDGDLVLI